MTARFKPCGGKDNDVMHRERRGERRKSFQDVELEMVMASHPWGSIN